MKNDNYSSMKIHTDVTKSYSKALKGEVYLVKVAINLDPDKLKWEEYFYYVEVGEWEALDKKKREIYLLIFTQQSLIDLTEK
jgi:hypothetical protein